MTADRCIRIAVPRIQNERSQWEMSTGITVDDRTYPVWYRTNQGPVFPGIEPFVAASVVPAMRLGYSIKPAMPLSKRLYDGIMAYQKVLSGWYPMLHQVPILAATTVTPEPAGRTAASFFSCGVDACYTLLSHYEQITDCILIHGFDYEETDSLIKETVSTQARKSISNLKRRLIEVETNIRTFGDQYADWGTQYHGSVLASVGHFLSPQFHTLYIPSSYRYEDLFPWGSHPEVDPLWSSEATAFVHDGCDASRTQKVARVADSEAALSSLRVCWSAYRKEGKQLNCGKCEKCIRTMIDLRIAKALDRCNVFRKPLRIKDVALTDLRKGKGKHRSYYVQSLERLRKTALDPELERALEACLSGRHYQGIEGLYRDFGTRCYRDVLRPMLRPFERTARQIARSLRRSA